jgi:hypothetical protein
MHWDLPSPKFELELEVWKTSNASRAGVCGFVVGEKRNR